MAPEPKSGTATISIFGSGKSMRKHCSKNESSFFPEARVYRAWSIASLRAHTWNLPSDRWEKSVTANAGSLKLSKRSRSRSRSPLTSAAGKRLRRTRESGCVLDARELINRKRAMSIVNEPVTKEKNELGVAKTTISGGKVVRIRDRESSKENGRTEDADCVTAVDDVWPENGDLIDENRTLTIKNCENGASSKLIINRNDGKRSVIAQSSMSANSSSSSNSRRVDLRGIKRTVYIDEEGATKRDEDEDDGDVHITSAVVDVSMLLLVNLRYE